MKLIVLLFLSTNVYAISLKDFEDQGRPLLEKYISVDFANSVFGVAEAEIELPDLPKLVKEKVKNSVSSLVLETQGGEFKKLSDDDKRKYRLAFLDELFEVTRMSKATDEDLGKWLNTLEQGSSREGIYRALVLDQVYYQLESFEDPAEEKVIKFASHIMEKFVGEKANIESMSKLNAYTVKRIICSKLLDMMETLQVRETDIYKWYAVLSGDLARDYSGVFKNTLRKNKSSKVHYEWAKQVPLDQIKTEAVLKVHRVFNYLMD